MDVHDVGAPHVSRQGEDQPRGEQRERNAVPLLEAVPRPHAGGADAVLVALAGADGARAADDRDPPAAGEQLLRLGADDGLQPTDVGEHVVRDVQHPAHTGSHPSSRAEVCRP